MLPKYGNCMRLLEINNNLHSQGERTSYNGLYGEALSEMGTFLGV